MSTDRIAVSSMGVEKVISRLVGRARRAMQQFAKADQARVDEAVTALAWSLYKPENAHALAELAVKDTGLGNVTDKIVKNQRKTFGTLRDLLRVRSVGIIEDNSERGIVKWAKPIGIVAAITPSTNPAATPVNKCMMALKGRNAVIVAPSPVGWKTASRAVELMRAELTKIGLPIDLVQALPQPVSKVMTQALMAAVELVVATGSQDNARRAYSSGVPAIGVGTGNVPVIIDASADVEDAARKIAASKCFDNATSCSSENAVILIDEIYHAALNALRDAGGYLISPKQKARVRRTLWPNGRLNRSLVARDAAVLADAFALPNVARGAKFFLVEEEGIGSGYPFSGEKLSLVLTVYRAASIDAAIACVRAILAYQGSGHSCGIHTQNLANARLLAEQTEVVRVLVNQAHAFGNGGNFDNGLNFTLSMGCGTWGGSSISENLNYRHFLNTTHLVMPINEDKPDEEALFGAYLKRYGR